MPERSLIDILWLSDRVLHYTRHFGPLSGLEPKLEDPRESYGLRLFAMASGLEVTRAARHMRGLIRHPGGRGSAAAT